MLVAVRFSSTAVASAGTLADRSSTRVESAGTAPPVVRVSSTRVGVTAVKPLPVPEVGAADAVAGANVTAANSAQATAEMIRTKSPLDEKRPQPACTVRRRSHPAQPADQSRRHQRGQRVRLAAGGRAPLYRLVQQREVDADGPLQIGVRGDDAGVGQPLEHGAVLGLDP